jgi:hypothetical protein
VHSSIVSTEGYRYVIQLCNIVSSDHGGRSNAGIEGSNPPRGIGVCVYSVFVLGSGFAMG